MFIVNQYDGSVPAAVSGGRAFAIGSRPPHIGMVLDIWTEKGNDGDKYGTKSVVREASLLRFHIVKRINRCSYAIMVPEVKAMDVSFSLNGMIFEYDEEKNKNRSNIKKHGISFEIAARRATSFERGLYYGKY